MIEHEVDNMIYENENEDDDIAGAGANDESKGDFGAIVWPSANAANNKPVVKASGPAAKDEKDIDSSKRRFIDLDAAPVSKESTAGPPVQNSIVIESKWQQ